LRALRGWRGTLSEVVERGIERKEIRRNLKPGDVANIIISSLEGGLMMSRLEKKNDALLAVQSYLESYLETQLRNPSRA
jgi:TetR/AcrR family transcriptional repressor of nem operon